MTNDRIRACLDGELPPDALTPAERERVERLRTTASTAAAALRAVPAPELEARVMAALPAGGPRRSPMAAALGWLWNPRPVRVTLRPAYGLAFAAIVAALLVLPRRQPSPTQQPAAPIASRSEPPVYVQFRIHVPDARSVALAGTFTGWKPEYPLRQTAPGEWTALVPMHPGVHDYAFVVDGRRWVADPNAPQVDDSFGGTNSRISLPPIGVS
jgi:hypothetical protein